jgi:hypothetical protein
MFLYFKIARVHKKEERLNSLVVTQYIVVAISALLLYNYGLSHYSLWVILPVSFLFFIVAALMVTAVQVGIFVEGKPLFGVGFLFKLMPFLSALIVILLLVLLF